MNIDADEPTPEEAAAAIAPSVDRVRLGLMNRALAVGFPDSAQAAGLDPGTSMMLAYLRNSWPDRVVSRDSVRAVFTYQPDKPVDQLLDAIVALGVVEEPGPGLLRLTPLGREVVTDLQRTSSEGADALWADAAPQLDAAAPLVERALEAARATPGDAFPLMAPEVFPPEMSLAGRFAEQLTGLRFHRFDAHIAAWRAAGYTVADLESLDDSARAAIEAATNERAGVPLASLSASERALLIECLEKLPS